MSFNFPNNPTDGQTVLHDNGKYYKWDATAGIWNVDVGKRIQDFIDNLIDASPEALNTLNELAGAINDDPAFFSTMSAANTVLQTNIDTEKDRIDAILLAADADKDSFAEIVTLINSVDTENDTAFASYVTSNNAAVAALQADVDQNETDSDAGIASNLALLNAQRALEWDAVFATHGSLYATTTTVG